MRTQHNTASVSLGSCFRIEDTEEDGVIIENWCYGDNWNEGKTIHAEPAPPQAFDVFNKTGEECVDVDFQEDAEEHNRFMTILHEERRLVAGDLVRVYSHGELHWGLYTVQFPGEFPLKSQASRETRATNELRRNRNYHC